MASVTQLAYYNLFGLSVIAWLGIITLLSIILTAMIPMLGKKGYFKNYLKKHKAMAFFSISLAIIHAIFVIGSRFK
ncbi:MAG: hypothetical protein ABII01_06585 [Candidatus Woesearchaeota archaeon]